MAVAELIDTDDIAAPTGFDCSLPLLVQAYFIFEFFILFFHIALLLDLESLALRVFDLNIVPIVAHLTSKIG